MIQPLTRSDGDQVKAFIEQHWHAPHICMMGALYYPHESDGFIARRGNKIVGLISYQVCDDGLLILSLNATVRNAGIGTSLLLKVIEEARKQKLRRIWLTTTNDNLQSLGFYQRMGFRLVAIHAGSVDRARESIKPEVPETGLNGLPIHDEIELELVLKPASRSQAQSQPSSEKVSK